MTNSYRKKPLKIIGERIDREQSTGEHPPIYNGKTKVIVFDYDDFLWLHKKEYSYGRKRSVERLHNQAKQVVGHALKYYDRVALWSATNPDVLTNLREPPFHDIHLRICGAEFDGEGLVKHLINVSSNLSRIVAMEDVPEKDEIDDETGIPYNGFTPADRVIRAAPHQSLMHKYKQTFRLLGH